MEVATSSETSVMEEFLYYPEGWVGGLLRNVDTASYSWRLWS